MVELLARIVSILQEIMDVITERRKKGFVDSSRFAGVNAIDSTMRERGFQQPVRSIIIINEGPEPLIFRIPFKREHFRDGRLVGGQDVTFDFDEALIWSIGLQCETDGLTTAVQVHGSY